MLLNIKKGDFVKLTVIGNFSCDKEVSKQTVDKVNKITLVINDTKYCRKTGISKEKSKIFTSFVTNWSNSDQEILDQKNRKNEFNKIIKKLESFNEDPSTELLQKLEEAVKLL